ncbi:MAG: M4 family metallopeptidase [Chloroflexota bacterium]
MIFFVQRRWLMSGLVATTAVFLLLVSLISIGSAAPLQGRVLQDDLLSHLQAETGDALTISYHRETGQIRFLGATADRALAQPSVRSAAPEAAALAFMEGYGSLFGIENAAEELTVMTARTLEDGRSFTRFQQLHQGIPIIGGEYIVQTNAQRGVVSANGEGLPGLALETEAAIGGETAVSTALTKIAKDYNLTTDALIASTPELWIYNPQILGGPGLPLSKLVWRLEITAVELAPIRELVLVDAQTGALLLNFNQIGFALNRIHYDNNNNPSLGLPGNGPVRTEGQGPTGITDVDLAYTYTGDTYNFLANEHGRDSINDAGMALITTTRFCDPSAPCPYLNAFWNGSQVVYGQGFSAADDVVAHEFTHGFTNFTSNLFYWYQSGAINESFSDVWGEFVDLTNSGGNDAANVRWLIGEDVPVFGAIRSMINPPQFNDPDRMGSPIYHCDATDFGGVHINSGVNNKATFLMTDGGTFNGQTVTGLGISRVADLYYEVQTNLLTSASDYADLHDALIQASNNLGFSANERQAVQNALNAVEMSQDPSGCAATSAPICQPGQTATNLFFDNFEAGFSNWSVNGSPIWQGDDFFATSGTNHLYGRNAATVTDGSAFMSSDITVPANAFFRFNHAYGFESGASGSVKFDGGIIEYSTNSGGSWNDAASFFTHNGYNGALASGSNPLSGRSAFGADSFGYVTSRLNLSTLEGQNVRFRFRIGTDSSGASYGWHVDDVSLFTCGGGQPQDNFAYLPIIIKQPAPPPPENIQPGFWQGFGVEHYVTPNSANVDDFAVFIRVTDCGDFKIVNNPLVPITNDAFAFTGQFFANGSFPNITNSVGTLGFDRFPINSCNIVVNGSLSWDAAWANSSQPSFIEVEGTPATLSELEAFDTERYTIIPLSDK